MAHQLVFWGCILAALVTFPLTLGLLHFQSVGQQADRYQVYIFRVGTVQFDAESLVGWLIYHALDVAAVLVLAGVFIFLRRRLRDPGALAVGAQRRLPRPRRAVRGVGERVVPHRVEHVAGRSVLLSAQHAARPHGDPRAHVHPVRQAVPHLPAAGQPRRGLLQASQRQGPQAACRRCGEAYASARQVADLHEVLPQVGFDYTTEGGGSYQDTCPHCRRALVTLAQSSRVGGFG